ncbi:MAG: sulfatase [Pseudomonadota bacterium]
MRNVLFIIVDDLNSWIGALGESPDVKTPNIDKLARRGTLFARAYCSAPYCNASRMGLFTGQYPRTNKMYGNERYWEREDREKLLMELLREQGVYTVGAGKVLHGTFDYMGATSATSQHATWREMYNRDHLWDAFYPFEHDVLPVDRPLNGMLDFSDPESIPKKYHLFDWGPLPDESEAGLPDTIATNHLINFLLSEPTGPFFCAAGFARPHLPWHPPQKYFDLYDREHLSLPFVRQDDLDDVPEIPRGWVEQTRDHELVLEHGQWRAAVHAYLASISYVDHQIGRLLAALEASGVKDQTDIILCSDNGFHLGQKLHWRKFVLWEEATRIPLIVSTPQHEKGEIIDEPVSLIDVYDTVLERFGIEAPLQSQSQSLVPYLGAPDRSMDRTVEMTWLKGNHSLRRDFWRYTQYRDGTEELYDHRVDPYEWTNLIPLGTHESVAETFRETIRAMN